ncbi:restriction endonuclease [Ideonella sp.]|jgi:restriction system protein|uniref:restriction endonuclease n=1 Tax=Ideonella sp. TaxID=1929293 RepID=UPI0037BEB3B3
MPQLRRSDGGVVQDRLAAIPWWVAAAVMGLLALSVTLLLRGWTQVSGPGGAARQLVFELLRWGFPALLGLCVLWAKRSAPDALAKPETPQDITAVLKGMPWAQFEKLVGEAFRQRRFAVLANGDAAGAEDVDMVLRKGGETHLVLCKHWRAERVGVQVLRDLQLTMSGRAAVSAYVLTAGHFSDDARAFAKAASINLVDGPRLARWLTTAQRSLKSVSGAAAGGLATGGSAETASPACPKCQATMMKRQARRGVHAGSTFWSCARYPQCHGARPFVAFSGAMSPDP